MRFFNWLNKTKVPDGPHYLEPEFFCFTGFCDSPGFHIDLSNMVGLHEAYKVCSPLSTVIDKLSTALSNAHIWVLDEDGKDVEKYNWVKDLFEKPNPLQTGRELLTQLDAYRMIYGEAFLIKNNPVGVDDGRPSSMYAPNPELIEVKYKNKLFFQSSIEDIIEGYYIKTSDGNSQKIEFSDIIHILDVHQNLNFGAQNIRGSSRIIGLEKHIKNILIANEAIYSLNMDRGAQGVLSNEAKDAAGVYPLDDREKKNLQKDLIRNYGLSTGQSKVIITKNPMKWQPMSYPVKDLMLYEGIQENIQRIADAFGYPYELLANARGVTYSNKSEAEKQMYQDAVIPISKIYESKITSFLGLEDAKITFDFSDVEALKEAEKAKAETRNITWSYMSQAADKGIVTEEELRNSIGY